MTAEIQKFYWGGTDNEDLYCVCGTPHPTVVSEELRRCEQCGAAAQLIEDKSDENFGSFVVFTIGKCVGRRGIGSHLLTVEEVIRSVPRKLDGTSVVEGFWLCASCFPQGGY